MTAWYVPDASFVGSFLIIGVEVPTVALKKQITLGYPEM